MDSTPTFYRKKILDIVEIQGKECDVNAWRAIGCSPMDFMYFFSSLTGFSKFDDIIIEGGKGSETAVGVRIKIAKTSMSL